jgi:hypothetical protein
VFIVDEVFFVCIYIGDPMEVAMTKYESLGSYLQQQDVTLIRLSFEQIERILGFQLPASAYAYPAWWSNTLSHRLGFMLAGYGFRTRHLDLATQRISFLKA